MADHCVVEVRVRVRVGLGAGACGMADHCVVEAAVVPNSTTPSSKGAKAIVLTPYLVPRCAPRVS